MIPLQEMQAMAKINHPLGSEEENESDIGPYKTPEDISREAEKEAFEVLKKKL